MRKEDTSSKLDKETNQKQIKNNEFEITICENVRKNGVLQQDKWNWEAYPNIPKVNITYNGIHKKTEIHLMESKQLRKTAECKKEKLRKQGVKLNGEREKTYR